MSIWRSINDEVHMLGRDNYTGELSDNDYDEMYVDLATAVSWHSCIRFGVLNPGQFDHEALMTVDEARQLIAMLTEAIDRIEAADD